MSLERTLGMDMVRIAIIDDGVDKDDYKNVLSIEYFSVGSGRLVKRALSGFSGSHATLCAKIISKYLTVPVSLISIKVLPAGKKGNVEDLLLALEWCLNQNVDIINLSLGTTNNEDGLMLEAFFNENLKRLPVVVAAQSNMGTKTYPACFKNVIGVRCDPQLFNCRYKVLDDTIDGIDIAASGRHMIYIKENRILTNPYNSYASAMISSLAANYIASIAKKEDKKELLLNFFQDMEGRRKNG